MDELIDSAPFSDDPVALRERLTTDGYLFFRGLLPPDPVNGAGAAVLAALAAGGWVDPSGLPSTDREAINARDALSDPAFREAIVSAEFNRIPYLAALRDVVRGLLGPDAFSYPVKVLRAVYPEVSPSVPRGRHVHQDYPIAGVSDLHTTWVPLMEIPVELGGLAVLPGSHLAPPESPRLLTGTEAGWVTTDYHVGDVVLFHCLTSHAALPNRGNRLRISQDSRWQPAEETAPGELIFPDPLTYPHEVARGPDGRQVELFSSRFRGEPWWEPTPEKIVIAPRHEREMAPPRSTMFRIHDEWSTWPAGARNQPLPIRQ